MLHIPCMYTSLLCSAHMRSSAVFFFIVHLHPIFLDHKKAVFTFNFLCASTAYFLPHTLDRDFFLLYVLPLLHPQFFMFIPIMAVAAKKVLFFTSLFTIGKKKCLEWEKKNFFWGGLNDVECFFFLFVYAMGIFISFFLHFKWKYMFECEYEIGLCCYCSWIKTQKK